MKATLQQLQFKEHQIAVFENEFIYARVYGNNGPDIFLLHGFPDNIHLYDYLVPEIVNDFRVIVFDFLGWHKSSKPKNYKYTAEDQRKELAVVINYFKATDIWLVAHDSSGPPAINYTLDNPGMVRKLVLLNTYYSNMPELGKPVAIWMFSTPVVRLVSHWVVRNIEPLLHLSFKLQISSFMQNKERRKVMVPKFYKGLSQPENLHAFLMLNKDLDFALRENKKRHAEMRPLGEKVLILFGTSDPNLNVSMAKHFHRLFPGSKINLIANASHYVQIDQPEVVASHLLAAQTN